jgi:tetratricopeptide (TPR) repeat protein
VLAHAAILLVQEQGAALLRPDDAARWLRIATAQAERFADPELAALTLVAEGLELAALGELETSVARFDTALPKLRELFGEHHPELARARLALSATAIAIGDATRAKREAELALASLQQTLGPTDLRTGAAEAALARALVAAGELPAARSHAELAVKVPVPSQSLRHDRDRGTFEGVLGDVLTAAGAHGDALAAYRDAQIGLYTGPTKADPLLWEARSQIAADDREAGLAGLAAARAELESQIGVDDPRLVAMLRAIAAAQRDAGEIALARATLSRAIELADAVLGYGPRTAELQWDLAALEEADGHRERSLELLDDAHVPMTSALGLHHPRVAATVLARADLAWALGQKDYAGRLYGAVLGELDASFGPKDARTVRARARKLDE